MLEEAQVDSLKQIRQQVRVEHDRRQTRVHSSVASGQLPVNSLENCFCA
jgi:hypothetical protein